MCNQYNGWSNYETWLFALWNDNFDSEFLQEFIDNAEEPKYDFQSKLDMAVNNLEDYLKESLDEQVEELNLTSGLLSDLLSSAISSINFREIARNMLEDIYECEEEDE